MGTGIGGGILLAGHLVRGANGMAGEFGQMQVVPIGHPCECGGQGCWEQYSSGKALVRFARERMGEQPSVLEGATGGNPDRVTGPMVTEAAGAGDMVARAAFASVDDWLGVGVALNALQRSFVGAARRALSTIVSALFGPEAGLVGAADLARRAGDQPRR